MKTSVRNPSARLEATSLEFDVTSLWNSPLADEAIRRFEADWSDDIMARSTPAAGEDPRAFLQGLQIRFNKAWADNDPKSMVGLGLVLDGAGALDGPGRRRLAWALLTQARFAKAHETLREPTEESPEQGLLLAQALAGESQWDAAGKALDAAEARLQACSPETCLQQGMESLRRTPLPPDQATDWFRAYEEVEARIKEGRPDLASDRVRALYLRRLATLRALLGHASADPAPDWDGVRDQTASLLLLGLIEPAGERLVLGLQTSRPGASNAHDAFHLGRAIAARWAPATLPAFLDGLLPLVGGAKRDFLILARRIVQGEAPWTAAIAFEPVRSNAIVSLAATVLARGGRAEPAIALFCRLLEAAPRSNALRRELVFCSGLETMGRIRPHPLPRTGPPKVFDLFPYNGEIEILKIKLNEMAPWVDRFVIVEAAQTFSGLPKPIHLPGQNAEIQEFLPKISHVVVDRFPDYATSAWAREYHQRDAAVAALQGLCAPDDLVLMSDADEVVDGRIFEPFRGEFTVLKMDLFQYFLNSRRTGLSMGRRGLLIAMRARHLARHSPSAARALLNMPLKANRIEGAGWHFTSVGDAAAIARKLRSYSHQENHAADNEAHYTAYLSRRRNGELEPGWERCEVDELPDYVRRNRDRLAHLIL